MKCKNRYCYYELDGNCIFGDTVIGEDGRCDICTNIRPSEERLNYIKERTREQKEKELEYINQLRQGSSAQE